jgi:bifunctional non-homologous end joining protein LigD
MLRRDGARLRCFTRNGYDWAARFPAIVDAAQRIKAQSFLIDGEAVIARADGMSDFRALRSRGHDAMLYAFDLIEHDGADPARAAADRPQAAARPTDRPGTRHPVR